MIYRLFVAGIIGFWLLMGTILIRTELFPERGSSLPVPVDYVEHLVFRHEQPSDLVLYVQKRRLDGSFHLQPRRLTATDGGAAGASLVNLSGNFLLTLPTAASQQVVFHGSLELDGHEQIRRVELSVSFHEPKQGTPGMTLHLDGRPAENHWHFQIAQGTQTLREGSGTPAEIIDQLELRAFGIDSHLLSHLGPASAAITVTAHRGAVRVNDEEIESFVVTIHQGEGMETAIYVSQLGQIIAVKTFPGYDLYDETLAP